MTHHKWLSFEARTKALVALVLADLAWSLLPHPPEEYAIAAYGACVAIILYVASFIGQQIAQTLTVDRSRQNAPPAVGDFAIPTATQGRHVPIVFGSIKVSGVNTLFSGGLGIDRITRHVRRNIFDGTRISIGYVIRIGLQFGVCRGPVDHVDSVEFGNVTVDVTGSSHEAEVPIVLDTYKDQKKAEGILDIHDGLADQSTNTWLTGHQSPLIKYNKTCYIVYRSIKSDTDPIGGGVAQVGPNGGAWSVPPFAAYVTRISAKTPDHIGLGSKLRVNPSGTYIGDMNPAHAILELLIDDEWGRRLPLGDVDLASFKAAGDTLFDEGNGFSMILDSSMDVTELVGVIEDQIDGVVFRDHRTGKYKINLIRDDYTIGTLDEITDDDVIELGEFTRSGWESTSNHVLVKFSNRDNDYATDYAQAMNMATAIVVGGGTVTSTRPATITIESPGVKDSTLANRLAWRLLQTVSRPLVKARVSVTRKFWDVEPASVLLFSNTSLGISQLPVRVMGINFGDPLENKIELELLEDIWASRGGSFAPPPVTGWTPPTITLTAFPTDEQLAFEAPRGIVIRDPFNTSGSIDSRIISLARGQGSELSYDLRERHASGTPSGAYVTDVEVESFVFIGQLKSNLARGTATPTSSIVLTANPDTQSDIEGAFTDDSPQIGTQLLNLILVNNEFMLVTRAVTSGADVDLQSVYRGVLDSVQGAHTAGDNVFLVFQGLALGAGSIPETDNVDVKLIPKDNTQEVAEGSATTISFAMAKRPRRPIPPTDIKLDGTSWASTASLEGNGSGAEDYGLDLDYLRRDYRATNEVTAVTVDAATTDPTYPAANSTTQEIDVVDDPDGSPTTLFTQEETGNDVTVLRIEILAQNDGVLPTRMQLQIRALHDDGADVDLNSRYDQLHDFDVTSALTGQFSFGARAQAVTSNLYTADAAGTHSFTLSTALPGGEDVEYRLNGGTWTQLIAGGGTSGSIAGVSVSDTIEVRHQGTAATIRKELDMDAPGAGTDGYFILID